MGRETVDDLQRNGYRLIQKAEGFRFGQDAVLLAAFASVRPGEAVLDLCTGTGVVPILMEARNGRGRYFGVEIQPEIAEMAQRSVNLNNLRDKIEILQGDIRDMEPLGFAAASFDVVTVNPPYIAAGGGLKSPLEAKAVSRHEILCDFGDVANAAAKYLKPGGRLYLIHRPRRLAEIITALRERSLEPKVMRLVHPKLSEEPAMALIEAARGGKPMLKVLPPLVIYDENGKYTAEAMDLYYG